MRPGRALPLLQKRLAERETALLGLVRNLIFEQPSGPYRDLMAVAGIECGDVEHLVTDLGVEGALEALQRAGVYLTVEEFKGRRAIVRGSTTIRGDPSTLANPLAGAHIRSQTSGSRGGRTPVAVDVGHIGDRLVDFALILHARGGTQWQNALWSVPGGAALINLLLFAGLGAPPVRWFSQIDPRRSSLDWRYRWSPRVVRAMAGIAGVALPLPEHVPARAPLEVASWMAAVLRRGGTPHLYAYTSAAVALCEAAGATGLPLAGAQFTVTGEPLTERRLAVMRATGASVSTNYGTNECGGFIGYGCLAPEHPDEVHLLDDLHAVVQVHGGAGVPDGALLVSSLRQTAPLVLLNVSLGDQAAMARRECGCSLQALGWRTHLHTIRSFEKLTAGGISLLAADVVRILEEVLPERFGGGPASYQVVEEAFLDALGTRSGGERVAQLVWRESGFLGVERREPARTPSGKVNHVQVRPATDHA